MTEVNTAVAEAELIIHSAIMKAAAPAAITAASAAAPWLKLPIISTLFSAAVNYAFGFICKFTEKAVAAGIIDGQISKEKTEYNAAKEALKKATLTGTPDEKAKASQDFDDALARLIHFDGS